MAYRERIRSTPLLVLAGVIAALALALAPSSSWWVTGVLVAGAVLALWCSSYVYEVSDTELSVRVGPGFPNLRFAGADIASVEASSVSPVRSGGLGYRGSWTVGKRVIISLGTGSGVTVNIRPKGSISMSSRRASDLQAAITQLIARTTSPSDHLK